MARLPVELAFTPSASEESPDESLYEPIAVLHFPIAEA